MNKSNIHGVNDKRNVNPSWFTNKTWMKVLSEKIKSKDQDIYHVHFEKGSRTKLHSHDGNQVLIATKGKGSLEIFRKYGSSKTNFKIKKTETIKLNEGDIVHIPAKTLHTHGSVDKKKEFAHIAINILAKKNMPYKTTWYESDFKTNVSEII
ncbi:cupin domain protein [Candidatus Nitrosopumilus salaria BD31]|uniref:Cupin domain protein n=1 Tax=Candidatus Nitrosopumilus salarius BD31 TaxID=859350 RepID=I3D2J2_9ARCH|nr:cupin domain-containing protein [Candidatus Nitrosopumilus salaria]EIJ65935.1 cupin domain protein [Candidatus Nitrosopumilus salaria BD31]